MTGSADPRRFLTGRPCQEEKGEAVTWKINCDFELECQIQNFLNDPHAEHAQEKWVCKVQYSGAGMKFNIPAVILPGPCMPNGGHRTLLQLRTCKPSERVKIAGMRLTCFVDVTWG
eukprot:scaffold101300_cov35-Prasinocladus_malaysianus.AAC.1